MQLVDRYIYAYSPNFEVRRTGPFGEVLYVIEPVYIDFGKLMELVNKDTEAMKKYRKDLLGSTLKFNYPDVHSEISACQKRNMMWSDWQAQHIRDKARAIAFDIIENMTQILDRHYRLTEERMAKYKSEVAKKK